MGIIFRLLSFLPLTWLHGLGGLLGKLVYLASPTYRRHLKANLGLALGEQQALATLPEAISQAGKQALELPKIWLRPLDEVAGRVVATTGWELVEEAIAEGKGIVFLTPHLGCFEITAQYFSTFAPVTVLYRPPKIAWLRDMVKIGRIRDQLKLAPADISGVRALIKALKKGEAVGLLPDQAPKVGEGAWLDFFGKPAYTMTLAARLTETGATTLRIWAERLPSGHGYHIHVSLPTEPLAGDTLTRAARINHEIQDLILSCPAQYLWGYNRYKTPAGAEPPPQA